MNRGWYVETPWAIWMKQKVLFKNARARRMDRNGTQPGRSLFPGTATTVSGEARRKLRQLLSTTNKIVCCILGFQKPLSETGQDRRRPARREKFAPRKYVVGVLQNGTGDDGVELGLKVLLDGEPLTLNIRAKELSENRNDICITRIGAWKWEPDNDACGSGLSDRDSSLIRAYRFVAHLLGGKFVWKPFDTPITHGEVRKDTEENTAAAEQHDELILGL